MRLSYPLVLIAAFLTGGVAYEVPSADASNEDTSKEENSQPAAASATADYACFDDASWAVRSQRLAGVLGDKQKLYDDFMDGCRAAATEMGDDPKYRCDMEEDQRMQMNMYQPESMYNYTRLGYEKTRTPPAVMDLLNKFWEGRHCRQQLCAVASVQSLIRFLHNHLVLQRIKRKLFKNGVFRNRTTTTGTFLLR